ncbi:hypothetical protein C7999DRAFT_44957 [Corynascus novoguineensis]|uniref:Uncharacterized protein n=1 Tax=Corynascus novoguineensis TaxID=1126955 RepID=A0AAN7CJC9_9PEZI|nr:hypothetical protein C7999DRAFT_44957 [Corynascus novoguineensis]
MQEDERDRRLAALGLVLYTPDSVLICRLCGYALQPKSDCVIRHLADKHAIPKHMRDGLARFIRSLHLPDPNTLPLRPDWSPAHPDLASHVGVACRHCTYRTTSADLITRHLAKAHDRRRQGKKRDWLYDEVIQGVPELALQTNWIRRTGWLETFDRANRGVLVRLAQLPCLEGGDLRLNAPRPLRGYGTAYRYFDPFLAP